MRPRTGLRILLFFSLACSPLFAGRDAASATVTINPSQDNTIADGVDPGSAEDFKDNSSGACEYVFSGTTADGFARRALLQFDVAGNVPAGSTINAVTLTLTVNRSGDNQDATMALHPVLVDWGEGSATCGPRGGGQGDPAGADDATWLDAEFGSTPWTSAGGDFDVPSATAVVPSGNGSQGVWSGVSMTADVQFWLDAPGVNAGWIVVGDEVRSSTSRRFSSREGSVPPTLQIDFDPPPGSVACCFTEGSCSVETSALTCSGDGGVPADPATDTCEPNPCPQPAGACCNLDESCSDLVDRLACEADGGVFQGSSSTCSQGSVDCGLEPFVDPLPIPPALAPTGIRVDGVPQYTVEVVAATQQLHSELPATDLWTYNGAYPSFTLEATVGEPIEVTFLNNLPRARGQRGSHLLDVDQCAHGPNYYADSARISTHLHGGHVPARVDGQPELTILPGETDVYEYPNNQDPATLWYHDHALGITRLNVYAGMAGFYLLRDDFESALGLPGGEFEIPIVIQDREFNPDGSLFYNPTLQDAFKGDRIVVNGKVWPFLNVKQGKYRLRLLNGSQAREYSLRLESLADPNQVIPFTLIGTDVGLTSAPVSLDTIGIMAPAERFDVIVDFAGFPAGTEIVLRNDELTVPLIPNVMKFVVGSEVGFTGPIPGSLRPVPPMTDQGEPTRYFRLVKVDAECANEPGRIIGEWLIETLSGPDDLNNPPAVQGAKWDDIDVFPSLDTREIWEFSNPSNSMHPMHVHLVRFQVLDKKDFDTGVPIPLAPWEAGTWKDTVRVPPRSVVRVIMDFEDYLGKFPFHCHILDHEDHEMMRQFQATNDPGVCVLNGTCDPGEDCVTCAGDCAQVSGALCGNGLCEAGDGENCETCAADCAGKQQGSVGNQFCCGFDDGEVTNPITCGVDVNDDRCIDSTDDLFCRVEARVSACCGDKLCEGQETPAICQVDCAPLPCGNRILELPEQCDDGNVVAGDGCSPTCEIEDADGDGIPDASDNCPLVPNAAQTASTQDGLVGIGCSCLCGDVNNSCSVSGVDAQDIQVRILPNLGLQPGCYQIGSPDDQATCGASPRREVRGCDVDASATCSGTDAQVIQNDLSQIIGSPTYPLPSGYDPKNCAQSTPDTCGEDAAACP
jgi:spore coat protein A